MRPQADWRYAKPDRTEYGTSESGRSVQIAPHADSYGATGHRGTEPQALATARAKSHTATTTGMAGTRPENFQGAPPPEPESVTVCALTFSKGRR